jgi:hypothetical protein
MLLPFQTGMYMFVGQVKLWWSDRQCVGPARDFNYDTLLPFQTGSHWVVHNENDGLSSAVNIRTHSV